MVCCGASDPHPAGIPAQRIESKKIKQKVQLVLYMPNFISVIVLCGIVRVLLSVTGPVNGLLHTSINFMTLPEAFRPIYIISGIWQGAAGHPSCTPHPFLTPAKI